MQTVQRGKWPKTLPVLTDEQERIRDDFFQVWLHELPKRYAVIEKFNHTYPLRTATQRHQRTLDIGAGRGEHLEYEDLTNQNYTALELRPELAERIRQAYPAAEVVVGDIQKGLAFPDDHFDRVLAIHVLEHLPNLPEALDEIHRLLRPDGTFSVLIPCDPGLAYEFARNISARRIFVKRYHQSYDWFIACEHINSPAEILDSLQRRFSISHKTFFPLKVPMVNVNLVIGMTLVKR